MSGIMENATVNVPAEKAEETKAEKFIRLGEYRICLLYTSDAADEQ